MTTWEINFHVISLKASLLKFMCKKPELALKLNWQNLPDLIKSRQNALAWSCQRSDRSEETNLAGKGYESKIYKTGCRPIGGWKCRYCSKLETELQVMKLNEGKLITWHFSIGCHDYHNYTSVVSMKSAKLMLSSDSGWFLGLRQISIGLWITLLKVLSESALYHYCHHDCCIPFIPTYFVFPVWVN